VKGVPDWLVLWGAYIAPLGSLVFSILAVGVSYLIYFRTGSRVKIETYFAVSAGTGHLKYEDASTVSIPITFLDKASKPVCVIRARNIGRMPVDVEYVGFRSFRGLSLPKVPGTGVGPDLPHSLMPGQSKYWMFSVDNLQGLVHALNENEDGDPVKIRAEVSLANEKTLAGDWVLPERITHELQSWKEIQTGWLRNPRS